jgi:transposase
MSRTRRNTTPEYRAEVVALIKKTGKSPEQVARELDLTESAVRKWFNRAEAQAGGTPPNLNESERHELLRLRKENQQLQMERDFLKKAAAFFAKESK